LQPNKTSKLRANNPDLKFIMRPKSPVGKRNRSARKKEGKTTKYPRL
jgi:hypothetical protein